MSENPIEVLITLNAMQFTPAQLAVLEEVSPRLHITMQAARRPDEISAETWGRCEVLFTNTILPQPAQAPALRWIQFNFAGVDFVADAPILKKQGLAATTLSGASAPQIAEFGLMMLLALGHRLPDLWINQQRADWPANRYERFRPLELRNATVGLVGYGSINRELARLLQPLGVTILAAKRDVMHPQDSGYMPEGLGDPDGNLFQRLYPFQAIKSMFKECDFVVIGVPLSPETRSMIGAEQLAALRPTACLVDFSRGGVVDQAALIQALQEHRLAGAALDVFPEEPLPATSPLWRMPNVIITPHIAGNSPHYSMRAIQLFATNLERYLAGEPLLNRYDLEKGY